MDEARSEFVTVAINPNWSTFLALMMILFRRFLDKFRRISVNVHFVNLAVSESGLPPKEESSGISGNFWINPR